MKRILSRIILPVMAGIVLTFGQVGLVSAASTCKDTGAKGEVLQGVGQTGTNCSDAGVENTVKVVVNILSYIIGIVATIMVMVGGFKYITSSGDSNAVANAKNTIVYALVGIVVAGLAQFLVRFVLGNIKI